MDKKPIETAHDIIKALRSMVACNEHKHTSYVCLHKTTLYSMIDNMENLLSIYTNDYCKNCSFWKHEKDREVAIDTIDRMVNQGSVTNDEALNLYKFVQSNYTRS